MYTIITVVFGPERITFLNFIVKPKRICRFCVIVKGEYPKNTESSYHLLRTFTVERIDISNENLHQNMINLFRVTQIAITKNPNNSSMGFDKYHDLTYILTF